MIIDFHTHIFSPEMVANRDIYINRDPLFADLYSNPKARLVTAGDLVKSMDEQCIDLAVVQNINWNSPELCIESNNYILESISLYPDRLIGFCMIPLDSPDIAIRELERCTQYGIKGVGEIRPSPELLNRQELLAPVIQKIIESNLILLTHTSEPVGHTYPGKGNITPEVLYPFIAAFPDLKLVCAHWGGGLPFYTLMPEVNAALNNVYFDSAASPFLYNSRIFTQAAQLVDSDKLLFGSDYPLISPQRIIKQIKSLDLAEPLLSQVLSGNAIRLLGLNAI